MLVDDFKVISSYFTDNRDSIPQYGKVVLNKVEYIPNVSFNQVIQTIEEPRFLVSLPIYCGKEWVSDEDILTLQKRESFIFSDEDTYYRGDTRTEQGVHHDTTWRCKFVSHDVGIDYNFHILDYQSFQRFEHYLPTETMTRCLCFTLPGIAKEVPFYIDYESFAIHVFHDITTKNNPNPMGRGEYDPRKSIPGNRY